MIRLLILMLLLGHISIGQTPVRGITSISTDSLISDSTNNSPNIAFNKRIKLAQIDNSSANVDIRLYRLHSLSNTKTLRRLFLVDTTWNAIEYNEWNKPVKVKRYKLVAINSFDSIFIELLSNNILTLPNQSELKSKMSGEIAVTAEGDTLVRAMRVLDGEGYTMEIKFGDRYRIYSFDNPDSYAKIYSNVSEFKNYVAIVETMNKWLQRNNNR